MLQLLLENIKECVLVLIDPFKILLHVYFIFGWFSDNHFFLTVHCMKFNIFAHRVYFLDYYVEHIKNKNYIKMHSVYC